jgi:ribonuclease HI
MNANFTCRVCGKSFNVAPAVLGRYPGWTPPLCNDCRTKKPRKTAGRPSAPVPGEHVPTGPQTGMFTDGSCEGNPGPGGWGAVKVVDGTVAAQASGASPQTTNNRMELTALIEGFKILGPEEEVTVFTDSAICANTVNSWAAAWKRNGWTRGAKHEPIANLDLVQELYDLAEHHPRARVEWIKGHAGYTWNEYADQLARAYQKVS